MRTAFIETLCELAEADERIWLVCGDLGYSVLERFSQRFPNRYVNIGVAEQNMTGVAAGLALSGKVVFTYSIANFPIMRCLEQVRNDVCYHNANVKIVAVGGGLAYGAAGYTHHGIEDLAVTRALPNLTIAAPGDPVETRLATRAVAAESGPCYLRLGKGGEATVHTQPPEFHLGRAIWLRDGQDVALISTGAILGEAKAAADQLAAHGLDPILISMPSLKPFDADTILAVAAKARLIVALEEHSITGGLGSAIAEVMAESGCDGVRLIRAGIKANTLPVYGSQAYLRQLHGLDATSLTKLIVEALEAAHRRV